MCGGRKPCVEPVSPGLHWAEITSLVGGRKMQRSAGRHQKRLKEVFSNLAIVSKGLFFGLLSHYAVMVAIFCLGIWLFLKGNTRYNVLKSSIYYLQFLIIVFNFHNWWSFRLSVVCWIKRNISFYWLAIMWTKMTAGIISCFHMPAGLKLDSFFQNSLDVFGN